MYARTHARFFNDFKLRYLLPVLSLVLLLITPGGLFAEAKETILFRDDFNTLEHWYELKFPKINRLSTYVSESQESGESYVRAQSDYSASGMMWKGEFDVYKYPMVRWRWKVSNIYKSGDAAKKSGDDYPMRIYVNFKYDTGDPVVRKSFKHGIAKLLYGKYPPYRSINYIWANRKHDKQYLANKYTKQSIMVPLQTGSQNTGQWIIEEVNVMEDYRNAFGEDPPRIASLAFMNDSDNTGEASVSLLDFIEIYSSAENDEILTMRPGD